MGALDHGIIGPALSSILDAYGVNTQWGVWSFTIYTLFFAVSIPVLGKLCDRFGRRQIFQCGIALFALGSLAAAFAPSFPVLLLGRAVQAIGMGGIYPITGVQIAVSYPPEQRGKMMGFIGMVFGLGTILGPILGGIMIEWAEWQWIFLINVPISIVILLGTLAVRQEQQVVRKPIDVLGIVMLTAVILSLLLGITLRNGYLLAAVLVFLPLLVIVERKSADPVMKLQYFMRPRTLVILASSAVSGFVMASATNMIPFFSETVLDMGKGEAGWSVAPLAAASVTASLIGGLLVDKIGAKRVLLLGFIITLAAGALLAAGINSLMTFYLLIAVLGFGIGIIIGAPLNVLMLQAVDPKETGSAMGFISLFRSVGSTLGPTMAGLFLGLYPNGFSVLFLTSSIVSGVSVVLLVLALKGKGKTIHI